MWPGVLLTASLLSSEMDDIEVIVCMGAVWEGRQAVGDAVMLGFSYSVLLSAGLSHLASSIRRSAVNRNRLSQGDMEGLS